MHISRRRFVAMSAATVAGAAVPAAASLVQGQEPAAPLPPAVTGSPQTFNEFTPQSERAVNRGNEWLMKTMHRDGGCGVDIGQPTDIGCTAMVGLALMAQGNTPSKGPRSREVQRILSFILRADENDAQRRHHQRSPGRSSKTRSAGTPTASLPPRSWPGASAKGWDIEPVSRGAQDVSSRRSVGSQTAVGHWGDQSWAPMLGR
jgi:hypothetical protein